MRLVKRVSLPIFAILATSSGALHANAQQLAAAQAAETVTQTRLDATAGATLPAITAPNVTAARTEIRDQSTLNSAVLTHIGKFDATGSARDTAELAAIKAFYEMRQGTPLWFSADGITADGLAVLHVLKTAADYGLDAVDYDIPLAVLGDIETDAAKADVEVAITSQVLSYARDARGARVDPSRLSFEIFVERPLIEPATLLTDLLVAPDRAAYLVGLQPRHAQFELLRQALASRRATSRDGLSRKAVRRLDAEIERITLNMEFWRWLPETLGETHIIANIPEYRVRVIAGGELKFDERVIVGKGATQTPLFSDQMDHVIFRPFWGVPNSIKVKKLLPGLLRGQDAVAANGLRLKRGSRYVNPRSIDWTRNDIRNFAVYQPPGLGNALGNVKFMFPNKHAIYMHDTPSKNLFSSNQRTYSAGCVRVRNPDKFAKVLLQLANGWSDARTAAAFKSGPDDDRVDFDRKLPVHLGYFTAWVDPETQDVAFFNDIYKHERHLRFALAGDYGKIVRVKRSVAADVQRIREDALEVSDAADRDNRPFWFGGGSSRSGVAAVPRAVWAREVFTSQN